MILYYKILIIAIISVLCDIPYLLYVKNSFRNMVMNIQCGNPMNFRLMYVIPIYLLIGIIIYFSIFDDIEIKMKIKLNFKDISKKIISKAFIIGVCVYGIYNLTNYSTIGKWDFNMIFRDSIWGGILFSIVSFISYLVIHYIE